MKKSTKIIEYLEKYFKRKHNLIAFSSTLFFKLNRGITGNNNKVKIRFWFVGTFDTGKQFFLTNIFITFLR